MLTDAAAGPAKVYPNVKLTHEVPTGQPVECLAEAAEHAVALIVGRRGRGGCTEGLGEGHVRPVQPILPRRVQGVQPPFSCPGW